MIYNLIFIVVLTFVGLWISAKVTSFKCDSKYIFLVALVSSPLGQIPHIGWVLSIGSAYFLLKKYSDGEGVIKMMILSVFTSVIFLYAAVSFVGGMKVSIL